MLSDIKREANGAIDSTVSKLQMMSRVNKDYQTQDKPMVGDSLIVSRKNSRSSVFNSKNVLSLKSSRKHSTQRSRLGSRKHSAVQTTTDQQQPATTSKLAPLQEAVKYMEGSGKSY